MEDDRSEPERAAALTRALAPEADVLFGPYGSGAGRAVAHAMAGRPEVVWNHGAAAVPRTGARMVDVLAPARRYWRGLPAAVGTGGPVAVVHGPGVFGAEVAAGALSSLAAARVPVASVLAAAPGRAATTVAAARSAGARWIAGGGRFDDDIELARAAVGAGLGCALVAMGVAAAGEALGDDVTGCVGPVQWDGRRAGWPFALPAGADYPAAQAAAAGLLAARARQEAAGEGPDAVWDAARRMRAASPIGPFAIDGEGRQIAHAPALVRWEAGAAGPRRRVVWRPGGDRA